MSEPADPDRLILKAVTSSARLRVVAERRSDITVGGETQVPDETTVTVAATSSALDVRVPIGTELVLGTSSGRVEVQGEVGPVKAATESGRVAIDQAAQVDVRSRSGRVDIGNCAGMCRVKCESGRVTVSRAGGLDVHTASGRVTITDASGSVFVRTTSGRVAVGLDGPAEVDAETVSGRIAITVASNLGAALTGGSGRHVDFDVRPGGDCVIRAKAVSGRIQVRTR